MIATQHRGQSEVDNLALARFQCNRLKGPNIASVKPETNRIVPLFNLRTDSWAKHFRVEEGGHYAAHVGRSRYRDGVELQRS